MTRWTTFGLLALLLSCATNEKPPTYRQVSEISLARMPSALETRIVEASYVPWDPLRLPLSVGDIIQNKGGIQQKWEQTDCFKNLRKPKTGQPVNIQSVTVTDSEGSFALWFLNLSGAELSGKGITAFSISLTDVQSFSVPTGLLSVTNAEANCQQDLKSDDHFPVSVVLKGKMQLAFFSGQHVSATINVTDRAFTELGLKAKGFQRSLSGDSVISDESRVLGFMVPNISAKEFMSIVLGESPRKLKEKSILSSYTQTKDDLENEIESYQLYTEFKDTTHSLSINLVELWVNDRDFTLKHYKGNSLGKRPEPLTITYSTSGTVLSQEIWDDVTSSKPTLNKDPKFKYHAVTRVPVGRDFSLKLASTEEHTWCGGTKPYSFYVLAFATMYERLNGLSFVFFIHKDVSKRLGDDPLELIELEESTVGGEKMFLPAYLTDFLVDNLRKDYGDEATNRLFVNSVISFRQLFPNDLILKGLRAEDFEGYRITFVPLRGKYAVAFHC